MMFKVGTKKKKVGSKLVLEGQDQRLDFQAQVHNIYIYATLFKTRFLDPMFNHCNTGNRNSGVGVMLGILGRMGGARLQVLHEDKKYWLLPLISRENGLY